MAEFPANIPTFTDFDPSHTLLQDNHAARHNKVHTELAALAEKVGVDGSSDADSIDYKVSHLSPVVQAYVDAQIAAAIATAAADATAKARSNYPVGSVYLNADASTNPGTLLGFGTWVKFSEGRMLVGDGTSDQVFTAGDTGGESNHILTTNEMPSHFHPHPSGGNWGYGSNRIISGQSGGFTLASGSNRWTNASNSGFSDVGLVRNTGSTGNGAAHNNLPSYVVVYMWKRTA